MRHLPDQGQYRTLRGNNTSAKNENISSPFQDLRPRPLFAPIMKNKAMAQEKRKRRRIEVDERRR